MLCMHIWARFFFVAILAAGFPVSAAPIGDTAKITVTRELVSLYGVPLMARPALTEQRMDWKIEPLFDALLDRKSHRSEGPSSQAGALRCVLDVAPSVEFLILGRVLYTCSIAGYHSLEFVGPSNPLSRVPTSHEGHVEIVMLIAEQGFRLGVSPGMPVGVSDTKSLAEQLAALRRLHPKESHLVIRVEDSVVYSKVREAEELSTAAGFTDVALTSTLSGGTLYGGTVMKASIHTTIRAHVGDVRTCYQAGLKRNPALEGRVLVLFRIDPMGDVVNAQAQSSTLGDQSVESCILAAVRRWKFDKPEGDVPVIVTYPFVFRAE
jgi:TonB family protein